MKKTFYLLAMLLPAWSGICGQDDFERYAREQETAFKAYSDKYEADFKAYSDSVNREFGRYLAEAWSDCPLTKPEQPIKHPVPPETFDPSKQRPAPTKQPVKGETELPPAPLPLPDADKKPPLPQKPFQDSKGMEVEASFFGTAILLPKITARFPRLAGADEPHVAAYWNALSAMPYEVWTTHIGKLKSLLGLNDWGLYLLIGDVFKAYCPQGSENEQTVFSVFTLNQLGCKAKTGRTEQELLPLIAFGSEAYNALYFTFPTEQGIRYSVIDRKHRSLSSVKCYALNHAIARRPADVSLPESPRLATDVRTKTLNDRRSDYRLAYNKNLVDFYATLPCVSFAVYGQAAPDPVFLESVERQLAPALQDMTQETAINHLLHFVQYAFQYKTDEEQFGYEKWFFAEETIASSYSDCEDRSILFAQLVRHLLKMPVVLVYYPGKHLATAVRFSNPDTTGDYVTVDGAKYLPCDPTYTGAGLGMGMPQLMGVPIEIIKLK
ncbi:MAG: hypothetical protein BACD_02741 [Bacteroides rodentium]